MSKLFRTNHLHPLVYFVADKPTKGNISQEVPLVGTKSYRTLLQWIGEMDIDISRVRFYNQVDKPFDDALTLMSLNRAVELKQIKVIALGKKAAEYLNRVGLDEYFLLFHPSGRNRLLNDEKFVTLKLDNCRSYIYGNQKPEKSPEQSIFTEQEFQTVHEPGKLE